MGKIQNTTVPNELYAEFLAAISDLTKSMAIAVARMSLRAQCSAAIADAEKAERAAEALYFATADSTEMTEQKQMCDVAHTATTGQQDRSSCDVPTSTVGSLEDLRAACNWLNAACNRLEKAQAPRAEPNDEIHPTESMIAMRMVQLQDRLGGFIKH